MSGIPLIQSVLFTSPYSGCRSFSGWPPPTCQPIPGNVRATQQTGRSPLFSVDRVQRPTPLIQNLQRGHFRPSSPYPSWVIGPGGEPVKPMPCIIRPPVGKPPYSIAKGIRGPSTMGPVTYGIAGGIIGPGGQDFVTGTFGQSSTHNSGWT